MSGFFQLQADVVKQFFRSLEKVYIAGIKARLGWPLIIITGVVSWISHMTPEGLDRLSLELLHYGPFAFGGWIVAVVISVAAIGIVLYQRSYYTRRLRPGGNQIPLKGNKKTKKNS